MITLPRPFEYWASAQPLRELFDHLGEPVLVFDRQGRLSFANSAALRLLGCESGQFIGSFAPMLGDSACQWLRRAMLGSTPTERLEPARLANGAQAQLSWQTLGPSHSVVHISSVQPAAPLPKPGPLQSLDAPVISGHLVNEVLQVLWDLPCPVALFDANLKLVDANSHWSQFIGLPPGALVGRDFADWHLRHTVDDTLSVKQLLTESLGTGLATSWAHGRRTSADGKDRWFHASYRVLADDAGQRFIVEILQDETAEHVAKERADRSARELDDWFDLSPVGMVLFDETGLLIRTNPAFDAQVGVVPIMLPQAPKGLQHLLAWGEQALTQLQIDGTPLVRNSWVPQADGGLRRLKGIVRCYRVCGSQRRFMAVVEDRSVDEERELAQVQMGALMSTAGVGFATFQDSNTGWFPEIQKVFDRRESFDFDEPAHPASAVSLQSIQRNMVLPESVGEYNRLQTALREAQRAEVRYAIAHPDLGLRWLLTRVEPATLASGKRTTSVVTLDITEQQNLLRELSTILESTTAGIAYIRGNKLIRCNQRFELMLGMPGQQLAGRAIEELFQNNPLALKISADTLEALRAGSTYETEFELPPEVDAPSVSGRWYSLSVRRTGSSQTSIEAIALLSDITRLKLQQIELEVLARDRELMFNLSAVGIAFVRNDAIERANDALSDMSGYSSEELSHLNLGQLFVAEPPGAQTLNGQRLLVGEQPLRRRDGRLLWVQVSNRLVAPNNPSAGFIASYVNVDARYRAEKIVAIQSKRTRSILDSVLVGIVTVGPTGIEWMNRSACRMFGGDLVDFVNQPISTVATPEEDHPFRRTRYLEELVEGEAETFECKLKARDRREFWIVGNAVVTSSDTSGRQLTYALLDIEQRRQAEARIAEAQASMQLIIEAAPLAIILWDADTLRIMQINAVAAKLMNRPVAECIGLGLSEAYPPDRAATLEPDMRAALASGHLTQREYRITSNGEQRTWDARYLPLAAPDHGADKLLLVASDITEQQEAQQAKLDAAITQREMLVREVHHRIKNNLQGVAGLLQQIAQRKPEVASVIFEVVGQVQAIAQVYGLQVGVIGPLRLVNVLEAIAGSVQRTFGRPIHFQATGDSAPRWVLPEAEAIPIALTVNELLTNAIKHSAKNPEDAVNCDFVADGPDGVEILISNTANLPPGFKLSNVPGGVSGLGLVRALMPRRNAQLMLDPSGAQVVASVALSPPCVSLWQE